MVVMPLTSSPLENSPLTLSPWAGGLQGTHKIHTFPVFIHLYRVSQKNYTLLMAAE